LEARFPPSAAYLDCPFDGTARTCVLIPQATNLRRAYADVLAFVRTLPNVTSLDGHGAPSSSTFVVDDTAYRLTLGLSRARPGAVAATLSFAFDRQSASTVACLRPEALFDDARLGSMDAATYGTMTTAIACHGADTVDSLGRTPLIMAVLSGNVRAVRALLRGGADPNHITQSGWTPLLYAARAGTRALLDTLLLAGADPSYLAPDGSTVDTLEPFNPHLSVPPGLNATALADSGPIWPAALSWTPAMSVPAPAAAAPAKAGGAGAATGARRSPPRGGSRLPVIVLELLALGTIGALAVLRQRRGPAGPVAVRLTHTDLPAMPVPGPFRRRRSGRRLESAPRSDDRPL
jgi:hypothetical protein